MPLPSAEMVRAAPPRPVHLPWRWSRGYTATRAGQLLLENQALDLPVRGGFVQSLVELEAEAERQSLIYAGRSQLYAGLYYIFGLPAAILAAIAGATALASTAGRIWAGIIALTSSALSAAVVFLDSGKQRDRAMQTKTRWDDLYTEVRIARRNKLPDYRVQEGLAALNSFYTRSSDIRAGRDPEARQNTKAATAMDEKDQYLFPEYHS